MNAHNYHDFQREAPNNVEAEQALLGGIFVNNEAMAAVEFLTPAHFHEPLHRRIFETSRELIRMGKMANPVTIKTFLPADDKVGDMTVSQYLARLAAEAVTIINAADYGRAIYDLATRRALIAAGQRLVDSAYDTPVEVAPRVIADAAIEEIATACESNLDTLGAVTFEQALTEAIDLANAAYMADGQKGGGISYGTPLERLIGALYGGQLIIIGGGTKQGKTALVGQMATGAALNGFPVDFYSGEMTHHELAWREIARQTGIPAAKQRRGELTETQFEQMVAVVQRMRACQIFIQNRRLTLAKLKDRWQRMVRKKGRMVLICDHIGLLDRDRATQRMDAWEFGETVTRELKATARDLDCPVIACSQLKKNTFADAIKGPVTEKVLDQIIRRRPRYADLIGAVERDADHVVMPFQPDVFLKEQEPTPGTDLYGMWESKMNAWKGKAQLVLALSREMRWPQHIDVGWEGKTTSFFETGDNLPERFEPEHAGNPMRLF